MGNVFTSNSGESFQEPIGYTQPSHVQAVESPRFDCNDPEMIDYLREHGYAVVKGVCCEKDILRARELYWKFLKEQANMLPDNPTTWTDENFSKVGSIKTGIIFYRGIGQSDFLWFMRLLPLVKIVFSKIYNTMDLISSFDGANMFRPWHSPEADEYTKTEAGWYHVDQGRGLFSRVQFL